MLQPNRAKKLLATVPLVALTVFALSGCMDINSDAKVDANGKFSGMIEQTTPDMMGSLQGLTDEDIEKISIAGDPNPDDTVTVKWSKTSKGELSQNVKFENVSREELNAALKTFKFKKKVTPSTDSSTNPDGSGMGMDMSTSQSGIDDFPWEVVAEGENLRITFGSDNNNLGSLTGGSDGDGSGSASTGMPEPSMDPAQADMMISMLGDSKMVYVLRTPGVVKSEKEFPKDIPGLTVQTDQNAISVRLGLADFMKGLSNLEDSGKSLMEENSMVFVASTDPSTVTGEANIVQPEASGEPVASEQPKEPQVSADNNGEEGGLNPFLVGVGALGFLSAAGIGVYSFSKKTKPTAPSDSQN